MKAPPSLCCASSLELTPKFCQSYFLRPNDKQAAFHQNLRTKISRLSLRGLPNYKACIILDNLSQIISFEFLALAKHIVDFELSEKVSRNRRYIFVTTDGFLMNDNLVLCKQFNVKDLFWVHQNIKHTSHPKATIAPIRLQRVNIRVSASYYASNTLSLNSQTNPSSLLPSRRSVKVLYAEKIDRCTNHPTLQQIQCPASLCRNPPPSAKNQNHLPAFMTMVCLQYTASHISSI